MWANNRLLIIISSVIFLGSIGIGQEAFAINLNGAAGCTALGGSFVGSTCTVDNSITIPSLVVFSGFTLEVGDGDSASSPVITITGTGSNDFDNSGTLNVRSDGSIVRITGPFADFDNNSGGMVTVEGSITVGRDYDNLSGSTTIHECSGIITVGAQFDNNNGASYTQRGQLNGALLNRVGSAYVDDSASCAVGPPNVSIDDVTQVETDAGTTNFVFTVTRSSTVGAISVTYQTNDDTATAGSDYTGIGATVLNFADGGLASQTVTVVVNGDNTVELDETFNVDLTSCTGCNIADSQGVGTITNDDSAILSIGDHSEVETNSGSFQFLFPLSLTNPVDVSITVEGTTSDGSATTADNDYVGGTGSVGFGAGTTSDEFNITVNGDVNVEPDENFFLDIIILAAGGRDVSLGDSQGEGTILNDDAAILADLSITKSDDIDPIIAGNTLTYTVTVDNAGPDDATNVVVTDTLPAGVTFVSTSGCAEDPAGVPTCSLGTIANGGSAQYTITVDVDSSTTGTIINTATVTADETDPDGSNNSVMEDTTVNAPGPAGLTILYGVDRDSDLLRVIDPTDASTVSSIAITLAGEDVEGGQGLAIDPTTGILWAVLKIDGTSDRQLVTIDPATGIATLIGELDDRYAGLEFDAAGDLYGLTGDGADDPARINILSKTNANVISTVCDLVNTDDDGESLVNANGVWYHFSAHTPGGAEPNDYVIEIIDINNNCASTNIEESGDWDEELIAAAYCPETDQIFLGQDHSSPSDLMLMSPAGVGTNIGEVDEDYTLAGLACSGNVTSPPPQPGTLVGVNQDGDIFTINTNTGAATVLTNAASQGQFAEIECPANSLDCFITTGGDPAVINRRTIAPINLAGVPSIGPPSPEFPKPIPGMEFVGNTLYASDTDGNLFIIDDPATASTTLIGNMGERMSGLAYDTVNGIMYGMNGIDADLYIIDLTDGSLTFIGNTGTGEVGGMEFGSDGLLYGGGNTCADTAPNLPFGGAGDIFTIDTATGVATRVGPTGLPPTTLGSCTGEPSVSGLTLVTTTLSTQTQLATKEGSKVHPRPTITLPFVNPGFCFDLICLPVEHGSVFTHLDLQTVDSGSTHTISLTIHCPSGVEKCNYVAIGASPPGTDMRDAVWKLVLTKNLDGTWTLTKEDPNGDLGDVTATTQKINGNQHLQATFTIEFLLAALLGSPPVGDDFPEGSQIINVEIRDNKGGYASYIFNEGFKVNDIYAYPEVETSFEAPLVYKKLCINEDEKDRKTCAFKMVQEWTIKQAEEKLRELYAQKGYDADSIDESEQN